MFAVSLRERKIDSAAAKPPGVILTLCRLNQLSWLRAASLAVGRGLGLGLGRRGGAGLRGSGGLGLSGIRRRLGLGGLQLIELPLHGQNLVLQRLHLGGKVGCDCAAAGHAISAMAESAARAKPNERRGRRLKSILVDCPRRRRERGHAAAFRDIA
jgi:hypothetical protein